MVRRLNNWDDVDKASPHGFEVKPLYDPNDDSITLFFAPDESRRERIDEFLTVYRSLEEDRVVGCHIKDVTKILDKVKALNIGVKTSSVTFGMLLVSAPWATGKPIKVHFRQYREVVDPVIQAVGAVRLPKLQTA